MLGIKVDCVLGRGMLAVMIWTEFEECRVKVREIWLRCEGLRFDEKSKVWTPAVQNEVWVPTQPVL